MIDIPKGRKIAILREQIERWRNTHYDAGISYAVGKTIEDQRMMENAKATMGNALKAIDLLEGKLKELTEGDTPIGGNDED